MGLAVGSGLASQVVVKDETTYGTAPSLTSGVDSFEIQSETLELKKTAVTGEGLAAGQLYMRTKRRVVTNYAVTGGLKMQCPTRNLGYWLRYMIGDFTQTPAEVASTGIYTTTFAPRSNMQGHSFSLQKGLPTADNATVEPFTETGCKLTDWTLDVATGGLANLSLTIDGRNELAGTGSGGVNGDSLNSYPVPALATFDTPTNGQGLSVFHFREATLYTGGTPTMAATTATVAGAPSVPASTVAVQNTLGFTVAVTIAGGTVTTILINGVSAGSGDGTYFLPPNQTIAVTYSAAPTWTWYYATVSLVSETALGNVKTASVKQAFKYDTNRMFLGSTGFKSEPIENGYRSITGSATIEFLSTEAVYQAFASDTTTSLELKFVGATVSTSNYLLDIIIPNIKFEGDSPKVGGPAVLTQAGNFTGEFDEATTPIQVTYQSEDITF
jgi:hypothetical protein